MIGLAGAPEDVPASNGIIHAIDAVVLPFGALSAGRS